MSPKKVLELALEVRKRLEEGREDTTLVLVDAIQLVIESERQRAARQTQVTISALMQIFAAATQEDAS